MQVPGARDVAVEFFTMSKSYNMAGWRVGYMVGNKELVRRWRASRATTTTAPSRRSRWRRSSRSTATNPVSRKCAMYQTRRDVLAKGLHEAGWMVEVPKASMYIWAKIPEAYAAMGSLEFAKKLLADARVAVSPGVGFGEYGDDHVRFALIENEERTRQAVRGIKDMFRKDGLL
jgi:alanine-synthesizing transaminase